MYLEEKSQIEKVLINYFQGIYLGDTVLLESSFHPDTILYGDINGEAYCKTLKDYIEGVKERNSPKEIGESFNMDIIGIDIIGSIAMAKLHVPMLGYNYYDYLSLTKVKGKWQIVNKLFTNVNLKNH